MTPDREPDPTVQIGRMGTITHHIDTIQSHLDTVADVLQSLFSDEFGLVEDYRMPNLEAMDLHRAMEDTRQGLRSMHRIAQLHGLTLMNVLDTATAAAPPHLSAVPPLD